MCLEVKFEKSQRDMIDAGIITKIVYDVICYACHYSAAKCKTSKFITIQYGRQMRRQTVLEKPSATESCLLWQHSYNYFLHFSFYLDIPKIWGITVV